MDRRRLLKNSLAGLVELSAARSGSAEAERAVRVMEELFSRFPANPV
jgi:hypothetical protein